MPCTLGQSQAVLCSHKWWGYCDINSTCIDGVCDQTNCCSPRLQSLWLWWSNYEGKCQCSSMDLSLEGDSSCAKMWRVKIAYKLPPITYCPLCLLASAQVAHNFLGTWSLTVLSRHYHMVYTIWFLCIAVISLAHDSSSPSSCHQLELQVP